MSDAKQKTREIIQTTAENAKIEAQRINKLLLKMRRSKPNASGKIPWNGRTGKEILCSTVRQMQ